jgi:2-dehydropantoate 2-reductase
MSESPKVLIVGAGAVGQVFGRHLQLGGARVTFFVKEKHAASARRGFELYPLGSGSPSRPIHFAGEGVVTTPEAISYTPYDEIYLAVASHALRGPWLAEFARAVGEATIVSLQPSPDDRDVILAAGFSPERLVAGLISFISYAAPLRGETRFPTPGMAYWFPPFGKSLFSGPVERTRAAVERLNRGGLPSKWAPDVPHAVAFPTAILMSYLIALESAGWSFDRFLNGEALSLGARAVRESIEIIGRTQGALPFPLRLAGNPRFIRLAMWVARRVLPLPVEPYLEAHFTKVGEQTRLGLASMIAQGHRAGLGVATLERLQSSLPARPLTTASSASA